MSFTEFRGEKRLEDLSARLFGKLKSADAKRARAALLDANPELEHLDRMSAGRPIRVPEVDGVRPKRDAGISTPREELVAAAAAHLQAYATHLRRSLTAERRDIAAMRKLLDSADFRRVVESSRAGGQLLEAMAVATERRDQTVKERARYLNTLKKGESELAEMTRG
jgi:hypothetical protein